MDGYAYELYDRQKVKAGIEELKQKSNTDISQSEVAEKSGPGERSLQEFLNGGKGVRADTIQPVVQYLCQKLDATEERFLVSKATDFGIHAVLAARTLRIAAYQAAEAALEAVRNLRASGVVPTNRDKLDPNDATREIDRAAARAIETVLVEARKRKLGPFSEPHLIVREEGPPQQIPEDSKGEWTIFLDEVDDSVGALRGTGGMVLASAYKRSVGWMCAVAVDLATRRLYSRVQGQSTQILQLDRPDGKGNALEGERELNFDHPLGSVAEIIPPKRKTEIKDLAVSINVMHADRLLLAAESYRSLLSEKGAIAEIQNLPGSRGPISVGIGQTDVSVETGKGYRTIDCYCGLLLAEGLGAVVVDEEGRPMRLDLSNQELESILDLPVPDIGPRLKSFRTKFIAAASKELAKAVRGYISKPPGPEPSASPNITARSQAAKGGGK